MTETVSLGISAHPCQFFLFLVQIAPPWRHIPALIHTRVVGSCVDVVALCNQIMRVGKILLRIFYSDCRGWEREEEPGLFYVLLQHSITKAKRALWMAYQHLLFALFAHMRMLLTYSIAKVKRALCDVAQFVADSHGCASWVSPQHFDHCDGAYRCR